MAKTDIFPERLIITGKRADNSRFRPSDWVEHISSSLAIFGTDHRLHYSEYVQPCIIAGEKSLVVARKLRQTQPLLYAFIIDFARLHQLRIQVDRRVGQQAISNERRSSGTLPGIEATGSTVCPPDNGRQCDESNAITPTVGARLRPSGQLPAVQPAVDE